MNNDLFPQAINNFRCHLLSSFDSVKLAYEVYENEANSRENDFAVSFEDYFYDWAQANWELLVERVVCLPKESLVIYGSGSDYEAAAHSRVFFHKTETTQEVICNSNCAIDWISKRKIDLSKFDFESFVSPSREWFEVSPPFSHVLFTEKGAVGGDYIQVVIPREQLEFSVQVIEI